MKYGGKYSLNRRLIENFTGSTRAAVGDQHAADVAASKGYTKGAKIGQSSADLYGIDGSEIEAKSTKSRTMSIEIPAGEYPVLRKAISSRAKEIADEQGHWGSAIEQAVREKVSRSKAREIAKAYFDKNGGFIEGSNGQQIRFEDIEVANSIGGSFGGDKNRSKITVKF